MGTRLVWLVPNEGNGRLGTWRFNPSNGVAMPVVGAGQVWQAWRDAAWDDITGTDGAFCSDISNPNTSNGCSYAAYGPNRNQGADARIWCGFEDPPPLVQFDRVKFYVRWDYCARPTNPYVFPQGVPNGSSTGPSSPPSNSHGPRARIMIRDRAGTGWLYQPVWQNAGFSGPGGAYPQTGSPIQGQHYCHRNRTNCANRPATYGTHSKIEQTWELFSHPEGGVWTFEDLRTLLAGVHSQCDTPAWVQFGQVAFVQVRFFHYYVELEVSDPGGYVEPLRASASHSLRLSRRPRNSITLQVPASEADRAIASVGYLSHPRGPDAGGEGWPVARIERRPAQILQRTYWPESLRVIDEHLDLRDIRCTAWGAFRIGIPWSPELSGLAYLDQGGDFIHERLQDAWSARPGDRVLIRIPEKPAVGIERPNLDEDGLSCAGPGDTEATLWNTNPGAAGWTEAGSGDSSSVPDDTAQIADELGYTTSERVAFGPLGGLRWYSRSVGALAIGDYFSCSVRVRNVRIGTPGQGMLFAIWNGAAWYDFGTRTWVAGPAGAPSAYAVLDTTGPVAEFVHDGGQAVVAGAHSVFLGRFATTPATPTVADSEFVLGLVSFQAGGTAIRWARPPLATLGATIVRVGEAWTMDNSGAATFWHRDRGAAFFELRPFWRLADRDFDDVVPIARQDNVGAGYDEVRFRRAASPGTAPDYAQFVRVNDSLATAAIVSVDILDAGGAPLRITRDHVVRVFVRWADDGGGDGDAPYQVRIGVAVFDFPSGDFVSFNQATAPGVAPDGVEDAVELGHTTAGARYLDGWLRGFEVRRNPVGALEASWRR